MLPGCSNTLLLNCKTRPAKGREMTRVPVTLLCNETSMHKHQSLCIALLRLIRSGLHFTIAWTGSATDWPNSEANANCLQAETIQGKDSFGGIVKEGRIEGDTKVGSDA